MTCGSPRNGMIRVRRVAVFALVVSGAGRYRAAFDDAMLEAALGAVERDGVALPGIERVQRIGERRAGVVLHDDVHRVFDVDVRPQHAAIAEIAVVLLVVEVQRLEVRIRADVQIESALLLFRAGEAALVVALRVPCASPWSGV